MKPFILSIIFFFSVSLFTKAAPSSGLLYDYYEGTWTSLPDFNTLTPVKSGTAANVDITLRNKDVQYAFLWHGYITIPTDGMYTFETNSDDGSQFYLSTYSATTEALVNNDGMHWAVQKAASIYLKSGVYPVSISFFQAANENIMEVYWSSSTGIARQKIPDSAFSNGTSKPNKNDSTTSTAPGLSYKYYEGNWSALPNFDSLTPVKSGTSANVDITHRNKDVQYAFLWQGYITVPAKGTYTFETNSDDGSKFYLGSYSSTANALVNNDGLHWAILKSASVYLNAGTYPVAMSFFQGGNENIMEVYWSSTTGIARQQIPDTAFSYGEYTPVKNDNTTGTGTTASPGLSYKYYEGNWSTLPDFDSLTPVKTANSANVDITLRNKNFQYAFLWQGYIAIPSDGVYTFETNSDDGSKLYIGAYSAKADALVNNDGTHWAIRKSASIYLSTGTYPISISFFQTNNEDTMDVYWSSSTGINYQKIPDKVFSYGTVVTGESGGMTGLVNYYFSTTDGDDSRTSTEAQSSSTPWKTLAKLNAVIADANPGTAFLLKRGDVFDGAITMTKSGVADSSIILSAYGSGNKPVVNGFTTLKTWTNVGGNIWQSPLMAGPRLNMLTINDSVQMRGRYPNSNTANGGYRTFQAHQGYSSITDSSLSDDTNWTGAEVSIKSVRWMLNTYKITAQNAGKISYPGAADTMILEPIDGFGYFIQNDPKTLDQQGEWYYNPAAQHVQLYSTVDPSTLTVKAAITDTLVRGINISYMNIDNVSFQGSNIYSIHYLAGDHINISNSLINFSGNIGVNEDQSTEGICSNNIISNSNNNGIQIFPFNRNTLVEYNTVINSGTIEGLGANGNLANCGILSNGVGSIVRYNRVIRTGYNGIVMSGSDITLRNNLVDTFCLKFDDGAALYTAGAGINREIISNIALHGIGNVQGTNADSTGGLANAIGLDDNSEHVLIDSNSVAFCSREGIGIHNTHDVVITNNTAYAIGQRSIGWANDINAPANPIRNITVKNNIFFANSLLPSRSSEGPIQNGNALTQFDTRKGDYDELTKFGVSDSNYWIKPFYINSNDFFRTSYRPIPAGATVGASQEDSDFYRTYVTLDFVHWQKIFNQDAHSISGTLYPPYTLSNPDNNTFSNGTFDANINYVLSAQANKTDPKNNYVSLAWDTAHLDKGALQVTYTPSGGTSSDSMEDVLFIDTAHTKTLLAGHTYRISFSIMGNVDNNVDFRCVLRSDSIGLSRWKYFKVYNTRSEIELLFTPVTNIPGAFLSVINDNANYCPVWWMDNLVVQEVNVTYTKPADYIRFEYNAGTNSKTISLDGTYTDVKNNVYNSTVTLAPYTSVILMKKYTAGSTVQSVLLKDIGSAQVEPVSVKMARVIPNPAFDHIQVSLPDAGGTQKGTITIYNTAGTAVKSIRMNITSQPFNINVSDLAPGAYIIAIDYAGRHVITKFLKL